MYLYYTKQKELGQVYYTGAIYLAFAATVTNVVG